jgi:hypothetical protein
MLRLSPIVLGLLVVGLAAQEPAKSPDEKKAQEEAAKKAVDDFNAAIKDAKTVQEKALAIQTLGEVYPKDALMVPPLRGYLQPKAGDINYLLPMMAAEALSKFRGVSQASQALIAVLPLYKKIPYIYTKLVLAVGKVGHESALLFFEEPIRAAKDVKAATDAIEAISEMPPVVALESLFRNAQEIDAKLPRASDDQKKFYTPVQAELLKGIKKVSGEPYPTLKELQIWWTKRGAAFKEKAAEKEKELMAKRNGQPAKGLPPVLLVELLFKENGGTTTANSGASCAMYANANFVGKSMAWSATAAPNGGPSSIDLGPGPAPNAVDLPGAPVIENLKNLKSFTICGWVTCKLEKESPADKLAPAGNRIVSWLNHGKEGVELIHRAEGNLQLGINQWADGTGAVSSAKQIPIVDEKKLTPENANQLAQANWRFFAVTYDSTAASGHVKFYFGTRQADAKLDTECEYARGPAGAKISPTLTIGNTTLVTRPMAPDRNFKGQIDEIRIFGSTSDGSGALPVAEIIKVQNRVEVQN